MEQKIKDNENYLNLMPNLKFGDACRYNEPDDLRCMNMDEEFVFMDGNKPMFVEFNNEPVLYIDAYKDALHELYEMFKDCKDYPEARKIILSHGDTLSADKGYSVAEGYTGNYYGGMLFLYGDDEDETIYWDVRWY